MIVHSRSEWTAVNPQGSPVDLNDEVDGLPNFRQDEVKGVAIHYGGTTFDLAAIDPRNHFEAIRRNDMVNLRYSDIKYNLGCAPREEGVWALRGLVNKGGANGSGSNGQTASTNNAQYVAIYLQLGAEEKPTDLLLDNLRDARNLVLAAYPNATDIKPHRWFRPTACPGDYVMSAVFNKDGSPKKTFWNKEPEAPVGEYKCPLPLPSLREGDRNIRVVELQHQLGFWGYYNANADGVYGPITRWGVATLQNDLKKWGYYDQVVDGMYGQFTYDGWCTHLKGLSEL